MNSLPPLVLLVEDDADTAALYQTLLTREGMEVVTCSRGKEARAWCQQASRAPDLLVIDVSLPDTSGLDLCREFLARGWKARRPRVMVLSAHGDPRMASLSRQAGANIFLDKLKDIGEFVLSAKRLLREGLSFQ